MARFSFRCPRRAHVGRGGARYASRCAATNGLVGRVCGARSQDGPARVPLTDYAGTNALATLADGNEVEILAWRPGGSGTRYRVRSAPDGLEGWLGVGNLRSARSAVSPAPTAPARPAAGSALPRAKQSEASGRRFGQRAH